jgi:hypothetical protein
VEPVDEALVWRTSELSTLTDHFDTGVAAPELLRHNDRA